MSLREYTVMKVRVMRELGIPKKLITEAEDKMKSCTSEIQIDNIARTILLNY